MRAWLRQPVSPPRWTVIACGLLIGLLAAGGIAGVDYVVDDVRDDRRTNAEVAAIAKRIFEIEAPTDAQLQDRVMRALRICARDPDCLRSLNRTVREASSIVAPETPRSPASAQGGSPGAGGELGPITQLPGRDRPGGGQGDGEPPPGPPRPPGPPSPGPPPGPPAIADVEIPPIGPVTVPPVCGPLLSVNCRP